MRLLCLTDSDPGEALPGLELLPHGVHTSPLGVRVPSSAAARFDLLLVDGVRDARRARGACLDLKRDCPTPRLLLISEAALPAVTPEWGISDVLLPTASPSEIDLRLRLARGDQRTEPAGSDSAAPSAISSAGVVIDEGNFTARVHDRTLDLTYKEFELLHFLVGHPGRVFTREQLLSEVWGTDYFGGTRTVDVHVRRLRAKLNEHETLISTVRGVGYGFARAREQDDE
ncbi:winged-helix domain-containing protein [Leucobacter weissii]|uniref:Winged-helix domain-containing protein n=1 Tax=Leucobacter weissii TaxID=1983706 RepID=A0A939MPC4_9MICO|nr:winged-helix domain-containing protein [Leucobacter weissii]MBO1902272.1 winged-helix domain-containing protein [Leucobacter weissii]